MKSNHKKQTFLLMILLLPQLIMAYTKSNELKLTYDFPATVWEQTLPLGNGRIGMMPDGNIENELIVLNDITMWSGSKDPEAINPTAIDYLSQIQQLLLDGKNIEAQKLMYEHFRCGGQGSAFGNGKDAPYGAFQMLANLNVRHHFPSGNGKAANYERVLSLNEAIAYTQFEKDGNHYLREYFASHAGDVLVIRYSNSGQKGALFFDVELSRPERGTLTAQDKSLILEGQLNDGHNGDKGVRYQTRLKVVNKGGTVSSDGKMLSVKNADETMIIISTSTDMLDKDYKNSVLRLLAKAEKSSFAKLEKAHIKAYQKKFDRVELNLGRQDYTGSTHQRLLDFQKQDDPAFAALYFQFGRYLMISGTNENSLPLNLQGLWANGVQTPWNGDYHLNINVQMNYWPAEVCNLPELHKPLIEFTKGLVSSGEKSAKAFYDSDGWVAHMMSNPWEYTAPGEHASWGATNTGGAWLCEHLWEHYAFSQDKDYLESVYPVLTGAARFFLNSMIPEPKNGWLVTAPSSSPENSFYLPGSNEPVFVCMGPTMDAQIVRELFTNILAAAEILNKEDQTTKEIREVLPLLPPMQISPEGYLQEWLEDYKEAEPKHRHVSHLYGLYPSNQISPNTTPELAAAARETLERRGDAGTGWSRAWKINFWARLQDGNRSYKLLKSLLAPTHHVDMTVHAGGGTYPNLFCAHPPFQIDGNFGGTSGIAEMLIQSHDGYIELLPALPDAWSEGSFKGLRVRGGAEVDADWNQNRLKGLKITAKTANTFKIKVPEYVQTVQIGKKEIKAENGFILLNLKKGKSRLLKFDAK